MKLLKVEGIGQMTVDSRIYFIKALKAKGITNRQISKTDIRYASDDNVNVQVSFVDLRNADDSISKLLAEVC